MKDETKKKLKWTTEKRLLSELKDHPNNPRILTKKSHDELIKSFEEFDYVELAAIDANNTIVAGHQRIHIMLELGWGDREIEVRVPTRKLTKREQNKYLLISNKVTGEFDYDLLANHFEMDELLESGFSEQELLGHVDEGAEDDELDEKDVDESIVDGLDLQVRFLISIQNEDATSLQNQLDAVLKGFPRAKMEKKI